MVHCDSNRIAQTATRENLQGNEKEWRRQSEIIIKYICEPKLEVVCSGCHGNVSDSLPDLCVCVCVCGRLYVCA